MKHIKNFEKFNESVIGTTAFIIIGAWLLYKFIKGAIMHHMRKDMDASQSQTIANFLAGLKRMGKIPVSDFADRFFIRMTMGGIQYDLRLMKKDKILLIDAQEIKEQIKLELSDEEFDDFLKLIKES
jgi:hypothetical protein